MHDCLESGELLVITRPADQGPEPTILSILQSTEPPEPVPTTLPDTLQVIWWSAISRRSGESCSVCAGPGLRHGLFCRAPSSGDHRLADNANDCVFCAGIALGTPTLAWHC